MARTVGYMLTWRTYGTWAGEEERLGLYRQGQRKSAVVRLSARAQSVVRGAVLREAKQRGERIEAIAVDGEHVHVVVRYGRQPVDEFVQACKAAGRLALKGVGYAGRVWATGYDRRFCFDEEALQARIGYVEEHGET